MCCAVKDQGRKRERKTEMDKERETQRKGIDRQWSESKWPVPVVSDFIKDINNQEIASDRKNREWEKDRHIEKSSSSQYL